MTEQNKPQNSSFEQMPEEDAIDLLELVKKIWDARVKVIKWAIAGAVIGLIVGFSMPKTFTATAVLAPETEQGSGASMSSIASMMGMNLSSGADAINLQVFPDVVHSTPFICELFPLEVETSDGNLKTTLLDYMENYQKAAWWSYILKAPGAVIGWVFSSKSAEDTVAADTYQKFLNLPKKERNVVQYFTQNISVSTDKKSGKTTLSLVMQDPLIAAAVASAVLENLKKYMIDYRTSKARQDVENLTEICDQRKDDYRRAQSAYAQFVDANRNLVLQTAQVERERLQQEMNLAYQVYSQVATQLEGAKIKEQQAKPVFAVIEPVSVPLQKTAPKKGMLLIVFAFLGAFIQIAWVTFGKDFFESFKAKESGTTEAADKSN